MARTDIFKGCSVSHSELAKQCCIEAAALPDCVYLYQLIHLPRQIAARSVLRYLIDIISLLPQVCCLCTGRSPAYCCSQTVSAGLSKPLPSWTPISVASPWIHSRHAFIVWSANAHVGELFSSYILFSNAASRNLPPFAGIPLDCIEAQAPVILRSQSFLASHSDGKPYPLM